MKELRKELCKFIIAKFGFIPPPNFGLVGISQNDFLLDKSLLLEFEDELGNIHPDKFGLWSGKLTHNGSKIRALATDICDNKNNYHEFIISYIVDNGLIHGLKIIYGVENYGLYIVKNSNVWKPVSIYDMLLASAGFEKISSLGLVWEPCDDYNELYEALKEIVDMG